MKRLKAAILFTALAIVLLVASIFSATAATPEKPMLELIDKGAGVYDLMLNEDTPKITTFQIAISGAVSEDFEVKLPDADWLIIGGAKVITAERTTFALGNMTTGGAVYPAGKIATIKATSPMTLEYEGKSHTSMEIATASGFEKLLFGIKVNEQSIDLKVGESLDLTVSLMPSDVTNKTVSWSSGNTAIASINSAGKLTALAEGMTVITASSAKGGHTATTAVTVTKIDDPGPVDPEDPTDPTDALPIHTIKPVLPTFGVPENIICVKPKAEYVPDTTTSVDRSIAIQQTADKMVYTKPSDLVIDGLGYIVGTPELLSAGNDKVKSGDILGLPAVTAQIPIGSILSGGFEIEGGSLMASKPEDVQFIAYKGGHTSTALKYVQSQNEFADGTFSIMDRWNRQVYGEIDPYQTYRIIFFAKDGGVFDLDGRTNGSITMLTAIYPANTVDVPTPPVSDDHKPSSGGGGGGCNACANAEILLLLPLFYFINKKFTDKKGR